MNRQKTIHALLTFLLILPCCNKQDELVYTGPRDDSSERGPQTQQPQDSIPARTKVTDTYFCMINSPEDYDWKQDSLCGNFRGKLSFYKNQELQLSTAAGAGSALGTSSSCHHILNGHLYLECNGNVMKDKDVFYETPSKEILSSMLLSGGCVYTLSTVCSGGFCLRCDGIISMKNSCGAVHPLYEDQGAVCMSYWTDSEGYRQFHLIRDGKEYMIPVDSSKRILDARYLDGQIHTLFTRGGRYWTESGGKEAGHCPTDSRTIFEDGQLVPYNGGCGAHIQRTFNENNGLERIFLTGKGGTILCSSSGNESLLLDENSAMAHLCWDKSGRLSVTYSDTLTYSYTGIDCLSTQYQYRDGSLLFGGSKDGVPFIWEDGEMTLLEGKGYVSAVEKVSYYK